METRGNPWELLTGIAIAIPLDMAVAFVHMKMTRCVDVGIIRSPFYAPICFPYLVLYKPLLEPSNENVKELSFEFYMGFCIKEIGCCWHFFLFFTMELLVALFYLCLSLPFLNVYFCLRALTFVSLGKNFPDLFSFPTKFHVKL